VYPEKINYFFEFMDFVNETKFEAGWTLGFDMDGRELLIVAIKATFLIPKKGEEPEIAKEQLPLTEADEFTGEPGFSATLHESDYAHRKPFCDVLLNGSAYAPGGRPTKSVCVGLRVGSMNKSFNVLGDRTWDRNILSVKPTPHKPFVKIPISYDRAYGGVDKHPDNPEKIKTYTKNPIGVGYHPYLDAKHIRGKPLPNTEEIGKPVKNKNGNYLPMSFGPIGRNFECRIPLAGTYDKKWLDNVAPFWPDDFDYHYFQAAPKDQQIPYPKGGEPIVLQNLTPAGLTRFKIPRLSMPVVFIPYQGVDIIKESLIDTIMIEPDQDRLTLTWRISLPLRKDCFELDQIIVGKRPRTWHWERKAAAKGKPYFKGISAYIKSKKE
jgi:hypothetical protein